FLLWGAYHGVLLLLHRQVEGLERRFDWTPPRIPWAALSWISTISLMNLGWIFFRSDSITQAKQMLKAVINPESYRAHFLTGTVYLLTFGLAVSYAVVLFVV